MQMETLWSCHQRVTFLPRRQMQRPQPTSPWNSRRLQPAPVVVLTLTRGAAGLLLSAVLVWLGRERRAGRRGQQPMMFERHPIDNQRIFVGPRYKDEGRRQEDAETAAAARPATRAGKEDSPVLPLGTHDDDAQPAVRPADGGDRKSVV